MVRSQRHNRPLSVLALDIDKFKTLNDSLGHLCGDFILRELAHVIRGNVRQEDLFARAGGEEFVFVLVETNPEGAVQVAERLRQAVAGHQFRFESTPVTLTVSIGVASTVGDPNITPNAPHKPPTKSSTKPNAPDATGCVFKGEPRLQGRG